MKIKQILTFKYYNVNNQFSRRAYQVSYGLIVMMLMVLGLVARFLPSKVPLFYSLPWGVERLAPWYDLFFIPVISFFVSLVNMVIGKKVSQESKYLMSSLALASFTVTLMFTLALIGILRSIL